MNERIQRALDGELDEGKLSPSEATELSRMETFIDNVLHSVPLDPMPDLTPAVLARIEDLGAAPRADSSPRRRGFLEWFWAPRAVSITWRPVYGLGAAAALLLFLVAGPVSTPDAPPAETPQVLVQFRLDAPNAREVKLAGEFTNWQPAISLRRSEPGVWTVVVPLEPGVHDYAFIMDGERWVPDPMAPAVNDGFGGLNSRVAVLVPDPRRKS